MRLLISVSLFAIALSGCGNAGLHEECSRDADCQVGLVCRDNGIRCIKAPCPNITCELPPKQARPAPTSPYPHPQVAEIVVVLPDLSAPKCPGGCMVDQNTGAGFQIQFTEMAAVCLGRLEPEMRIQVTSRIRSLADNAEGVRPTIDFRGVRRPLTLAVNRTVVGYDVDPQLKELMVLWVEYDG